MDDLGTEIRKFHRFVVRQSFDDASFRNTIRIRTHHSIDVRPDGELARLAQRGENRGRIVTAVAPQRRLQSILVRGNETRNDCDSREFLRHDCVKSGLRLLPQDRRSQFCFSYCNDLARINPCTATLF